MATHRVVIVGGGFGGLYAAKAMGKVPAQITLLDKRNFHLFQPLLYQVATGGISPGDIASPLRAILSRQKNVQVLQAEAIDLDPEQRELVLADGRIPYDSLIIATGVHHHYFGKTDWETVAPGLKTVEDALEMRRRILWAFEAAEKETNPDQRRAWMSFIVVGGGPTGVELAGALGELAKRTLRDDFRQIDPSEAKIFLLEGQERILPNFDPYLSEQATKALTRLGITVCTKTFLTDLQSDHVTLKRGEEVQVVPAKTVLWGAGVTASGLGKVLQARTAVSLDKIGRVMVLPDLSLPNYPEILVIGDLAHFAHGLSEPLPGVAAVAMQQGEYVAKLIRGRLAGAEMPAFHYRDKGALAVIGRNQAVAQIAGLRLSGIVAWLIWIFVHIAYLIEFDNKLLVLIQWAGDYFTRKRGARLITGGE